MIDLLSATSVLPSTHSTRAPEPQVSRPRDCRRCLGNGQIGIDRGPGHPGDSAEPTGRPVCKHCNGEGVLHVERGSHWDVSAVECGFCDGSGVGTTEQRS